MKIKITQFIEWFNEPLNDMGFVRVHFLIWPSIILSIVGTLLLTLFAHLFR